MTRKNYRALAEGLGRFLADNVSLPLVGYWGIVHLIADELKRDNPRFDATRFYEAVSYWRDHYETKNAERLSADESFGTVTHPTDTQVTV